MATSVRDLGYGDVEVYNEETLGIGSYGKVCKAKCGQLPCAAKLLHDTMFGNNDPGIRKFVKQFEQECRFLRMIKHPNIVQFLGTVRDPQSQRLALLMELMDESLTSFLERSIGPSLTTLSSTSVTTWHSPWPTFTPMISSTEISPATMSC